MIANRPLNISWPTWLWSVGTSTNDNEKQMHLQTTWGTTLQLVPPFIWGCIYEVLELHHTMEANWIQKYCFNLLRQDILAFPALLINKENQKKYEIKCLADHTWLKTNTL